MTCRPTGWAAAAREPGAVSAATSASEINRLNRQRQVTIFAGLLPGFSQTGRGMMTRTAESINMGRATALDSRDGPASSAARAELLIAFGLSLIFMYLILAAQFESWLHPVTILLADVPLTPAVRDAAIIIRVQFPEHLLALGLRCCSAW